MIRNLIDWPDIRVTFIWFSPSHIIQLHWHWLETVTKTNKTQHYSFSLTISLLSLCKMDIFILKNIFVIILEFQHRHGHGHCDFKYNRVNKVRTLTENLLYHTASYTNNSSATFHIGLCKWREHHINLIYNYISTAFLHNIIHVEINMI